MGRQNLSEFMSVGLLGCALIGRTSKFACYQIAYPHNSHTPLAAMVVLEAQKVRVSGNLSLIYSAMEMRLTL